MNTEPQHQEPTEATALVEFLKTGILVRASLIELRDAIRVADKFGQVDAGALFRAEIKRRTTE